MKKSSFMRLCALMLVLYVCNKAFAAFGDNNLAPIASPALIVEKGETNAQGKFACVNYGGNAIKSFHYRLSIDGKVLEEKEVKLAQPIAPTDTKELLVNVPTLKELGDYKVTCEITKVNGQPNTTTFSESSLNMVVLSKKPKCRVVFEDYTALWCQYCPRATVIMEDMSKRHPDDFIGIAIHSRDAVGINGYSGRGTPINGYPTVWASRRSTVKGYSGEDFYIDAKNRGAEMDIEVQAEWDVRKTSISVQSFTTFRRSLSNARYALAYVIIEDGMQSRNWAQANYFSGMYEYERENSEFKMFTRAGNPAYGLKYNHVAREFKGIEWGLDNSLPSRVTADKAISHKVTFSNIGTYWQPQNKNNLHVVVLVIDRSSNYIVNAARCSIGAHGTTGVEAVNTQTERVEVARFNLKGQRLSAPEPGINVVKYNDGTVKKVLVR
jgi:hypothetical protein